jgi:hypothetical protein
VAHWVGEAGTLDSESRELELHDSKDSGQGRLPSFGRAKYQYPVAWGPTPATRPSPVATLFLLAEFPTDDSLRRPSVLDSTRNAQQRSSHPAHIVCPHLLHARELMIPVRSSSHSWGLNKVLLSDCLYHVTSCLTNQVQRRDTDRMSSQRSSRRGASQQQVCLS